MRLPAAVIYLRIYICVSGQCDACARRCRRRWRRWRCARTSTVCAWCARTDRQPPRSMSSCVGLKSLRLACTSALLARLWRVWQFEIGACTPTPAHARLEPLILLLAHTTSGVASSRTRPPACCYVSRTTSSADCRRVKTVPAHATYHPPVVTVIVIDGQTLYCILPTARPGRSKL